MLSFKGTEDDVTWTYGVNSAICWSTASALKQKQKKKKRKKKKRPLPLFCSINILSLSNSDTLLTSEEPEYYKIKFQWEFNKLERKKEAKAYLSLQKTIQS